MPSLMGDDIVYSLNVSTPRRQLQESICKAEEIKLERGEEKKPAQPTYLFIQKSGVLQTYLILLLNS
jgi:hypothetical protein